MNNAIFCSNFCHTLGGVKFLVNENVNPLFRWECEGCQVERSISDRRVCEYIMGFFDWKSLKRMRLVCKDWARSVDIHGKLNVRLNFSLKLKKFERLEKFINRLKIESDEFSIKIEVYKTDIGKAEIWLEKNDELKGVIKKLYFWNLIMASKTFWKRLDKLGGELDNLCEVKFDSDCAYGLIGCTHTVKEAKEGYKRILAKYKNELTFRKEYFLCYSTFLELEGKLNWGEVKFDEEVATEIDRLLNDLPEPQSLKLDGMTFLRSDMDYYGSYNPNMIFGPHDSFSNLTKAILWLERMSRLRSFIKKVQFSNCDKSNVSQVEKFLSFLPKLELLRLLWLQATVVPKNIPKDCKVALSDCDGTDLALQKMWKMIKNNLEFGLKVDSFFVCLVNEDNFKYFRKLFDALKNLRELSIDRLLCPLALDGSFSKIENFKVRWVDSELNLENFLELKWLKLSSIPSKDKGVVRLKNNPCLKKIDYCGLDRYHLDPYFKEKIAIFYKQGRERICDGKAELEYLG